MKCPFCAEEIHDGSVKCVHCQSDLQGGGGLNDLPMGVDRNVILVLVLSFVTCGIYGIIHWFLVAGEINRHSGEEKLNPAMDLLLAIVTCGLWTIYMCYKYPRALYEMEVAEGQQATDNSVICLVLGLVGLGFVPFLILQHEMNEHWKKHMGGGVRA
jgi:hypothetical protein